MTARLCLIRVVNRLTGSNCALDSRTVSRPRLLNHRNPSALSSSRRSIPPAATAPQSPTAAKSAGRDKTPRGQVRTFPNPPPAACARSSPTTAQARALRHTNQSAPSAAEPKPPLPSPQRSSVSTLRPYPQSSLPITITARIAEARIQRQARDSPPLRSSDRLSGSSCALDQRVYKRHRPCSLIPVPYSLSLKIHMRPYRPHPGRPAVPVISRIRNVLHIQRVEQPPPRVQVIVAFHCRLAPII